MGVSMLTGRWGVENAHYSVIRTFPNHPNLELRRYDPHILAMTTVPEPEMQRASSRAFRHLAGYIFGGNRESTSIAMTAPVQLNPQSSVHTVSFVLPSKYKDLESLPAPSNPLVELQAVPQTLQVVRRLGVSWARFDNDEMKKSFSALERDAAASGLKWSDATVTRQVKAYDPPWVPFFMRRTEVSLFPVEEVKE